MKFFGIVILLAVVAGAPTDHNLKLDGRIVGGQEVDISDFPYQASVRIYDQHICGGCILDANTILTAAHCAHDMDHTKYSVRVGNSRHALGISHRVAEVRENSNYNPDSMDNDMAILKLANPISFSSNAWPIELQPQGDEVANGTTAWVSGWGVLNEDGEVATDVLRAVDVAVVDNNDCNGMYYNNEVSSHMMCAQTLGHDACQGDSGGPLVANGRLVGVVSWGYGCARPEYPGVYAKVADMHAWIVATSK